MEKFPSGLLSKSYPGPNMLNFIAQAAPVVSYLTWVVVRLKKLEIDFQWSLNWNIKLRFCIFSDSNSFILFQFRWNRILKTRKEEITSADGLEMVLGLIIDRLFKVFILDF